MSLAKGSTILFYLLKEPAFSFINLYDCFFHFIFIHFCSDLYDFFLPANLGGFLFSFFLMSLAKGLPILFIFSKNQILVLLIFTIVSFISFLFISAQIFMISFLLLILGFFVLLFPVVSGVKLGCLFDVSLVS